MADKHTISDLYQMQALPLNAKIRMTQNRIDAWVKEFGEDGVYVSFSGGKDSTVLVDIVRNVCGYMKIPLVFVDVPTQYPELRDFVRTYENIEIIRPKISFAEVCRRYGFPLISKEVSESVYGAKRYLTSLIADVQIMLTQLGIIFNCVEEVNERIDFKIDRQMGRIKEREAKRDVC